MFEKVVEGLGQSGCARGARVILEKPFGRDLLSAQALADNGIGAARLDVPEWLPPGALADHPEQTC